MLRCVCGLAVTRKDKSTINKVVRFIEHYKGDDLKNDLLKVLNNASSDENLDLEVMLELMKEA